MPSNDVIIRVKFYNPNVGNYYYDDTNKTIHIVADESNSSYKNATKKGTFTFGKSSSENFSIVKTDKISLMIDFSFF